MSTVEEVLSTNPLVQIFLSTILIGIIGWIIQETRNAYRKTKQMEEGLKRISKESMNEWEQIVNGNEAFIRREYNDLQNYLIRAPIITRQDIQRLHALRIEMENNNRTVPKKETKIETKDLTPLSEQLEKLKK